MNNWVKLMWSTAGGLGLLPKAPGTWGSLAPLIIVLVCGHFGLVDNWLVGILIASVIAFSIVTILLFRWYSAHFGRKDPPQVVCDEVAGQSFTLLGMAWLEPNNHVSVTLWTGLAIFACITYRIFDIWKPWIIDKSQRLPRGWGVLMDDILAGFFGGILVLIAAIILS